MSPAMGFFFFQVKNTCQNKPVSAFRKLLSVYIFSYFPFGFEGRMWDLIVSVPAHCLSFYLYALSNVFNDNVLLVQDKLKLFDSIILPIHMYGSEIWGFCRSDDIEKVHLRFVYVSKQVMSLCMVNWGDSRSLL